MRSQPHHAPMYAQLRTVMELKEAALSLRRACLELQVRNDTRRVSFGGSIKPGYEPQHRALDRMIDGLSGIRGAIYDRNADHPRPVIRHDIPAASPEETRETLQAFAALCKRVPGMHARIVSLAGYLGTELAPSALQDTIFWNILQDRLEKKPSRPLP